MEQVGCEGYCHFIDLSSPLFSVVLRFLGKMRILKRFVYSESNFALEINAGVVPFKIRPQNDVA